MPETPTNDFLRLLQALDDVDLEFAVVWTCSEAFHP
jgi:hypothetical protein